MQQQTKQKHTTNQHRRHQQQTREAQATSTNYKNMTLSRYKRQKLKTTPQHSTAKHLPQLHR